MFHRIRMPLICMAALVVGALAVQSQAWRTTMLAAPSTVATVDLERVFVSLRAFEAANEELRRIDREFNDERTSRREEIERLQEDFNMLPVGSTNRREAEDDLLWKSHEFQVMVEMARRKLDDAEAQSLRRIYKLVEAEASALASDRGIDLIVIDDTRTDLPENASAADMTREIGARRHLHIGRSIDITDELIARINAK